MAKGVTVQELLARNRYAPSPSRLESVWFCVGHMQKATNEFLPGRNWGQLEHPHHRYW